MEDGEVEGADSDEPTAFGHQQTEELPSSAALREKSASGPDERADCPGRGGAGKSARRGRATLRRSITIL